MTVLENPKWELFAQGLAKGLAACEAYEQAGYKSNRGNATTLKANQSILNRVTELVESGADIAEIDIARTLKELGRIGFSDLRNVFTSMGGILDPQDWDDETAAAISSIEVVRRPSGEYDEDNKPILEHVHKIKVWDKVSALEKIGKHLCMFTDRVDHTSSDGTMTPADISETEIARRLAFILQSGIEADK